MKVQKIVALSVFLCASFSVVYAETGPSFSMKDVKALIAEGKCSEAIPPLKKKSSARFSSSEGEKASVLLAECYLREHKKTEAGNLVSRFLEFYPVSVYRERMETVSAILQIEGGAVYGGVETLLRVLSYTDNPNAYVAAKNVALQTLAASLLNSEELTSLLEKSPADKDVRDWITLQIGRETQNQGRYASARYWYNRVIASNASYNLVSTAQRGLASLEGRGAGIPSVLVLAPLSGEFAEFGTEVIQGILLAYDQGNFKGRINLRIADTRADAATALWRTKQAIQQDSVIAVIGPVMSASAATVAAWLGFSHPEIPMLTPTATDDGIAKMGQNIFQINITMDYLAQSIADYAIKCLGIREFAVLAPVGDYGTALSQSFVRAVEQRGGTILAYQNFEEGRPDYKTEFDLLRNVRFKQENRKRNIAKGLDNADWVSSKERKSYMQDSVFNFPGVFIPSSSPADAGLMAGQFAFNKLSGTLLGTSGWYGRDLLVQGKRLVENSYFSVPAVNFSADSSYKAFAKSFQKKWNTEPRNDKVSGLSYTAANIVFSSFAAGNANLVSRIMQTRTFPSVYGDVRFRNGANQNAHVLTVNKGQFVEQTECPVH